MTTRTLKIALDRRDRCPKCGSADVVRGDATEFMEATGHSYGPEIAVCGACKALWEPIHHDLIFDHDDPVSSFTEPCSNCAFRPGSNEQRDRETWSKIKDNVAEGAGFYCHKGVPIEAGAEHGFAYPTKKKGGATVYDTSKLRVCRGWLNAWSAFLDKGRQS
jgi:hypothetical protein